MKNVSSFDLILDDLVADQLVQERYNEIAEEMQDPAFCSALKDLYIHPETFSGDLFRNASLGTLIKYLEITHNFYLQRRIPEIEQTVFKLVQSNELPPVQSKLIELFFQSYTNQLAQHIESEEKGIIAYAKSVESGRSDETYHTEDYLEQHDDVDSVLNRLCILLNNPSEPSSQLSLSNLLSTQLQLLQRELHIHSLLEEQVFLDILIQKEKKFKI